MPYYLTDAQMDIFVAPIQYFFVHIFPIFISTLIHFPSTMMQFWSRYNHSLNMPFQYYFFCIFRRLLPFVLTTSIHEQSCTGTFPTQEPQLMISSVVVATLVIVACNTMFPPVCKNNYTGQILWQTQKCECVM